MSLLILPSVLFEMLLDKKDVLAFVLFYFAHNSHVPGNTFIFSDGTVVQQEDGTGGGDILLYVLDPTDVTIDPAY
jgi:hypothetical protein